MIIEMQISNKIEPPFAEILTGGIWSCCIRETVPLLTVPLLTAFRMHTSKVSVSLKFKSSRTMLDQLLWLGLGL